MNWTDKIIEEYQPDYCHFLEATYGENMLSEGGTRAIDEMFKGIDLKNKRILDIGSGLGGVAFHLAQKYDAQVTGLEVNPWLSKEAARRCPENLKQQVQFIAYTPPKLPFDTESFDIVCSKGVLVHVESKDALFAEFNRVLKPGGLLCIDDWLSHTNHWGKRINEMCETEGLTLFPQTPNHYAQVLQKTAFTNILIADVNQSYAGYNQTVVDSLNAPENKMVFVERFGQQLFDEAVQAYQLIRDAINDEELLIRNIKAYKLST